MKTVRYTANALRALKRHGNMAHRIRKAICDDASGTGARANNVTQLVGSDFSRLRVGDFRVIFLEREDEVQILKIAPRGDVYE